MFFKITIIALSLIFTGNNGLFARMNNSVVEDIGRNSFKRVYVSDLLNADAEKIVSWLGEPDLKRFDYPVEIWLYRRSEGAFFIYFEQRSDGLKIRYVEARNKDDNALKDIDGFLRRNF